MLSIKGKIPEFETAYSFRRSERCRQDNGSISGSKDTKEIDGIREAESKRNTDYSHLLSFSNCRYNGVDNSMTSNLLVR